MQRSAQFDILITKQPGGYQAVCLAFPELTGTGRGVRAAYASCKRQVMTKVAQMAVLGEPIPADPFVQSKTLRLDLWYLLEKEDLR